MELWTVFTTAIFFLQKNKKSIFNYIKRPKHQGDNEIKIASFFNLHYEVKYCNKEHFKQICMWKKKFEENIVNTIRNSKVCSILKNRGSHDGNFKTTL